MASVYILAVWIGVNLAAMAVIACLGLMPTGARRWTALDDVRLAQWAQANAGWD